MPSQEAARAIPSRSWTPVPEAAGTALSVGVPNLVAYQAAVADLVLEVTGRTSPDRWSGLERTLADRLTDPAFDRVLSALPGGTPAHPRRCWSPASPAASNTSNGSGHSATSRCCRARTAGATRWT